VANRSDRNASTPATSNDRVSPDAVRKLRTTLTTGEDVVDTKTWAGSIPTAFGIAPRVRIGANRWFNLVWLIPIGFMALPAALPPLNTFRPFRATRSRHEHSPSSGECSKDQPDYPGRFQNIGHARRWVSEFFEWYAHRHRHSGLAPFTPSTALPRCVSLGHNVAAAGLACRKTVVTQEELASQRRRSRVNSGSRGSSRMTPRTETLYDFLSELHRERRVTSEHRN
jgi:hypothetical protein